MKKAVFIFGAPGSGKGTQANLLAWIKGFYHFDSGKYLRSVLYDPANKDNKVIQRELKLNASGKLNTPSWILGIFKRESKKVFKAGMSLVYSGSPRTMYEAFGKAKTMGLVSFLEKMYGKGNVRALYLKITPEASAKRNMVRRTCIVCSTGVLANLPIQRCPICDGELKTRVDDKPEIAKTRIKEYETRTLPILEELKKQGMEIIEINGERPPYEVHADILKALAE